MTLRYLVIITRSGDQSDFEVSIGGNAIELDCRTAAAKAFSRPVYVVSRSSASCDWKGERLLVMWEARTLKRSISCSSFGLCGFVAVAGRGRCMALARVVA